MYMKVDIVRQRNEGEPTVLKNGAPEIIFEGHIGAMVKLPVLIDMGMGYFEKDFQKFVRPPGVRIIAVEDKKILFTKEFRHELNDFDYRLPGGKIFDSLDIFLPYITEEKEVEEKYILSAAFNELKEEASKIAKEFNIFKKSHSGASVGWDLHYVIAKNISDFLSDTKNEGEQIEEIVWKSFDDVQQMCFEGVIKEGRTAAVLMQFIHKNS